MEYTVYDNSPSAGHKFFKGNTELLSIDGSGNVDITGSVIASSFNDYEIEYFTESYNWSGSPITHFTPLGKYNYSGGPIHVIASDSGCNMGGNVEFYIPSTYSGEGGWPNDVRVYSLGDTCKNS